MKTKLVLFSIILGTVFSITSCKKDYAKLSTEFIRNLPDSCEFLVQVDNDAEHLVYFKSQRKDMFYCYDVEKDQTDLIQVPQTDLPNPKHIGAGNNTILIGYKDHKDGDILEIDDMNYAKAVIMKYDIITRKFQEFVTCNDFEFNYNTKQLFTTYYGVDRYGDGTREDNTYDFDGKLLSNKEVEISNYQEVAAGTNSEKQTVNIDGVDDVLNEFQNIIESAQTLKNDGWPTTSNMGIKVCDAYDEILDKILLLQSRGFTDQQELRFQRLSNEAERVFNQWKSMSE